MQLRLLLPALLAAFAATPAVGQRDTAVVAGERYRRSGLHHLLFGTQYRDLWTAPVRARVLDLRREAGGLEPTRLGGGKQTKTLRFRGADGFAYVFRSIDKTPDVLPPDLEDTFLQDILQDQVRALHPGAPLIAATLLDAAGIPHARPSLVVMPDVVALGEFRDEFAGRLGYFERRATVEEGRPGYAGALEILDSDELLPRLLESPTDRVDMPALVAARLMDQVMGDWDRHRGNWSWGRLTNALPRVWLPLPEDRDNAFVRYNGVLLALARNNTEPQLVKFGDSYSSIAGMSYNGQDIDRFLLGTADRTVWDSIAVVLQSRLTDAVIDSAVRSLPEGWREIDGPRLGAALRHRRDGLPVIARTFYHALAQHTDLHLTAAAETVTLDRAANGDVLVRAAAGGAPAHYARRYSVGDTRELRVYLRGGADRVVVTGTGPARIRLRIIADSAAVIHDSSSAGRIRRHAAEWTPQTSLRAGRGDSANAEPGDSATGESLPVRPLRDWGARTMLVGWFGGGPDEGIFVGGGARRVTYGFRKQPWAGMWTLRGGWAMQALTGRLSLEGIDRRTESRVRTEVSAWASGIEVMQWHGAGNETVAGPGRYNRVNRSEIGVAGRLVLPLARHMEIAVGPVLEWSDTREQANRIIFDSLPYGLDEFGTAGLRARINYDSRDNVPAPTRGLAISLGGTAWPGLWSERKAFSEVHAGASTYFTARGAPASPTIALRAGGKKVFGRYPFAEAAFIGDGATVRLGRQNRFGGDAAAWGGADLRLSLARHDIVLPGMLGVHGLAETGRVFVRGERSTRWHSAVGGGVWFSVIQPKNVVAITVARSSERMALYVAAGFAY